jgi:tetratricopeptide (TPR) repeat protein
VKYIKEIAPIFALSVLASCGQQSDTPKADKFPGFVQIGTDKETSRLFVDIESVTRNNDGVISFKLLRVIDSGYAIQDAVTNCRDNFQGLIGTKFTADGASDSEYPGDVHPLLYKSNPAFLAMVNKVCEKADESRMITGAFDDIKALELVYGPYHPEVKAAYWTGINPPASLSQSASSFTKTDGLVKIVFSQEYREGNDTKRILLTQTNPAEGGNDCHACGVLLGATIFVHVGDKWRIESENRYLDVVGANGEPPELTWTNIGKDEHVITVKMTDMHQGVVEGFIGIYKLGISGWQPLLELNEEGESLSDIRLAFSNVNSKQAYAEALIRVENESQGAKTVTEKKFIFNGSQYLLHSPDSSLAQTAKRVDSTSTPQQNIQAIQAQNSVVDNQNYSNQSALSESSPSAMVNRMLEFALNDGGLSQESEIQQIKLQLEGLPKPEKGNKKVARAINDKGLASSKEYDFNNAVKLFEEANSLDKSDIEIISNLGFSYLKQGNLDLAQQAIITTLTMSPGRATAWANLGEVFGAKGDISHAVACFSNTYRFSKDRLKTQIFMKKLNETENIENIKQARAIAIDWAAKSYPDIN